MKAQIVTAVLLSVVLVGGATWFRFLDNPYALKSAANLQLAAEPLGEVGGSFDDVMWSAESTNSSSTTPKLNQTDILGRQLFSDYMTLSTQKGATSNNLNLLAVKFSDGLGSGITSNQEDITSLKVVNDSKENILSYSTNINLLKEKYKNLVAGEYNKNKFSSPEDKAFAEFMVRVSTLYEASAKELLAIKVPLSLSQNHLNLINNYLESATATRNIGNIEQDPLLAYKAMNVYAQNAEQESTLLLNIQMVIAQNLSMPSL